MRRVPAGIAAVTATRTPSASPAAAMTATATPDLASESSSIASVESTTVAEP